MVNLSGITGLWIDGKPVRRASLGGKVFYEKHNYNLSLSSDKDILSYEDGDVATLTATLTDYGEPVEGETVVFSIESTPWDIYEINDAGTYVFNELNVNDDLIIDLSGMPYSPYNTLRLVIGDRNSEYLEVVNRSSGLSMYQYKKNGSPSGGLVIDSAYASNLHVITDFGHRRIKVSPNAYTGDIGNIDFSKWSVPSGLTSPITITQNNIHKNTDVNGECSVSYDIKGTGDLNIKCDCMNLQETYVIEDCQLYSSNEYSETGNNESEIINGFSFANSENWVWEYDMKSSGVSTMPCLSAHPFSSKKRISLGVNGNRFITFSLDGEEGDGGIWNTSGGSFSLNTYYAFKIIKTGTRYDYYVNDVLKATTSSVDFSQQTPLYLHWRNWGTGTTYLKNIKIKLL